ncbi:hypothetical protein GGS23DRAFT_403675 [Durotheca rogersii]|uniref:uncharacterized protein n=1 Tax=Durotheca rogersii TaxID=419775 RepID=UPI00221E5828|nr:uncharacterized protein GGS23DRAFT_403675 [Durotheca rogersii]KAI5865002.1 hypothetical protein GGS23DRAFT_403675 [Durotheca rogersii]
MRHHARLASDGIYLDFQTSRLNAAVLGGTVDYHNSLLDQHRQQQQQEQQQQQDEGSRPSSKPNANSSCPPLLQWLPGPLSNTRRGGSNGATRRGRRAKEDKDQHGRDLASAPRPRLTRKDLEEFEALPIAIRRKYFSTLERLRFAQTSGILDQHLLDLDSDLYLPPFPRRAYLDAGTASAASSPPVRPITAPTFRGHAVSASADFAFLAKLPAKVREKHLTREEQVIVAKQLRQSVILDAADEAILKISRRMSRHFSPPPTLSSSARPSMDSLLTDHVHGETHDAFYDSFRWLDEDDDLDLSLAVDEYPVHPRVPVPVSPKHPETPAFRRHLSFSKIPFGRSSMSSSRPATTDTALPIAGFPFPSPVAYSQHGRRKSRAFSLITPKQSVHDFTSPSIDPAAAHYQDPEARLKLRVYLASPQKFDEAIEFGFPSNDASSSSPYGDFPGARAYPRGPLSADSEQFKTFLADDESSTYSEDASVSDPESPRTPQLDKHARPLQLAGAEPHHSARHAEAYAQAPAASREMTLRMTLTRPDLRACEDQIYGWQPGPQPQHSHRPSRSIASRGDMHGPAFHAKHGAKESIDKIFADIDRELGPPAPADNGVMKRLWNRVRRS